ncbi:glycosyltransferase family 1 protein [Algoriphagus aestuarii]|nr:glycosyltransferase family 1 protein [Algoriphagus aestuarii]
MKILLVSIGTRGDVEPFLAQAEIFSHAGHQVTCLFPEQFRDVVVQLGYPFIGFDKRFLEMLDTKSGKNVMGGGGNGFKQLKGYLQLVRDSMKIQDTLINLQRETLQEIVPDKVLFHPKALYFYLCAKQNPKRFILLSPLPCLIHTSENYPHIGLSKWGPFSPRWNLRSYSFLNGARHLMMKKMLKRYYSDFPGQEFSSNSMKTFEEKQLKTVYTISPSLFPKPENWPNTAYISGYFFRNQTKEYQTDPKLEDWLKSHPKAALLTFGSMSNPKPKYHSEILINLLVKHKIPTVVNLSWGGLEKVTVESDLIYYVNQIPYDRVLPKIYGIIHHGGSGTTHQAAYHGCVQMIIPHIIDQYFWNKIITNRQLGPNGVSIHKLTADKFEHSLLEFWNNANFKDQSLKLAQEIKTESNKEAIIDYISKN